MFSRFLRFSQSEDGAVTADWVVLCALVLVLGAAIASATSDSTVGLADGLNTYMSTWEH
ncbi:hypothetical protein [Primorskyibacter sp. S87]|uniref:hypothetical protein n=1 Tax=Primorskyibacter sp. S87 TaxID=3415126 RepID=UPI003C7D9B7B